jgi:hypothetical protein
MTWESHVEHPVSRKRRPNTPASYPLFCHAGQSTFQLEIVTTGKRRRDMITSATLYRLSGLALLMGALLEITATIVAALAFPNDTPQQAASMPQQYVSAFWLILALVNLLSVLLEVGGLPGICVRQRAEAGRLGLVGFILTLVGSILIVGVQAIGLLVLPYLAENAPRLLAPPASYATYVLVAALLLSVGVVLLGLATMRAGIFPRWAGLLLVVSIVINLVSFSPLPASLGGLVERIAAVVFALGLASMGYVLLAERQAALVETQATPQMSR